jgi:hypothetical protein
MVEELRCVIEGEIEQSACRVTGSISVPPKLVWCREGRAKSKTFGDESGWRSVVPSRRRIVGAEDGTVAPDVDNLLL